jgi:hypothetical protein
MVGLPSIVVGFGYACNMWIRLLPLICAVFPVIAALIAYWLGVDSGRLPACIPWLDGCTSISATGRHPPGSFVFRAFHLPFATLLALVWYYNHAWLGILSGAVRGHTQASMLVSGLIAALSLIIYVTFLGTTEPIYEFMRRIGIYGFFLGTAVAQLILSVALSSIAIARSDQKLRAMAFYMLILVALPFALGILNLALKAILEDADAIENRIEWIATLVMQVWFVLLYLAWKRTGFKASVEIA